MHGCLCEWERGTWHSSCPTCRGSTDSWALGAHASPSSSAYLHISTDLPPPLTPSPSRAISLTLPLFPVVPHILAQFLPPLSSFPYAIFTFRYVRCLWTVCSLFLSTSLHIIIRFFYFLPDCVSVHSLGTWHKATRLCCLLHCCFRVCLPDEQQCCN